MFVAIERLPTFEAFLLAVMLAGAMQMLLAATRAGVLGEFIPSSVVTGMLAAIGLILILKQLPHAFGYDGDYEGDFAFFQSDGRNTFSALWHAISTNVSWGAVIIAGRSARLPVLVGRDTSPRTARSSSCPARWSWWCSGSRRTLFFGAAAPDAGDRSQASGERAGGRKFRRLRSGCSAPPTSA